MSQTIPNDRKQEIINKIHEGMSVRDASVDFGVSTKTIYRWLRDGLQDRGRKQTYDSNNIA